MFGLQKSKVFLELSETMAARATAHTVAVSSAPLFLLTGPDRDVTWHVMTTAGAGRSVGAGVGTGAWERQPQVIQIQQTSALTTL